MHIKVHTKCQKCMHFKIYTLNISYKKQWAAAYLRQCIFVSCTVSPGFQFDGFTLASPEFEIAK